MGGGTSGVSRRRFLAGAMGVAASAWIPVGVLHAGEAGASGCVPPGFPAHVPLFRRVFENWAKAIRVEDVWTCSPQTAAGVVDVANWAATRGYRLRPVGMMHNWSPFTLMGDESACTPVVLVDTRALRGMELVAGYATPAVRVGAGALMEDLLGFLETNGLGMTAVPAPGGITVGGVLAIDGHGAAIPAAGELRRAGHTYGSVSNLLLSATYVAWDADGRRFRLRTVDRRDPMAAAVAVNLGRAFVVEAVLQVGANYNLRCQSFVGISYRELFAPPGTKAARTFASFLDSSGRAEAIWYPHTENPWLKVWSVTPVKPLLSRRVFQPYNYPFSDNVPDAVASLAEEIVESNPLATPAFGTLMSTVTTAGLVATLSADIWGPSKNTLLYVKPTTLRVQANGYAVLTRRANVQSVLHEFVTFHLGLVSDYAARGAYPANMPIEIRVTGLDQPGDVHMPGAVVPGLSAVRPVDGSGWDVAIWLDLLTFPGTPLADQMYERLERWLFDRFQPPEALVRPEWSKGWGYTAGGGPWSAAEILDGRLPAAFPTYASTWALLGANDPLGVCTNPFLDRLA